MKTASMNEIRDQFTSRMHEFGESETVSRAKSHLTDLFDRWRQGIKAIRLLINNPEDTEQVFKTIAAFSGRAIQRSYRRFRATNIGYQILQERRDLLSTLQDRESLAKLPEDSFGRAYLKFTMAENLTADGLVKASYEVTGQIKDPDISLYRNRIRDSHDLWHTLTGYNRDVLGEACLLAFTYAQTRNKATAMLAAVGVYKIHRAVGGGVVDAVWRAFRDGRRAAWLPAQDIESLLPMNIKSVRSMLSIPEPWHYRHKLHALDEAKASSSA